LEEWLWEEIPDYSYDEAVTGTLSTDPRLQIVGILDGGLLYYTPGQGDEIEGLYLAPFDPGNRWGQFVIQTVNRYGNQIDVWEVGNEAGVPQALQPDNYIQAVRVACAIITQEDEGARVVLGAPEDLGTLEIANMGSGFPNPEPLQGWTANWQSVLHKIGTDDENQDVENCVSAISLHSYGRPEWSRWMIEGIRAFLNQNDWRPDIDFWITESGMQSGDRPGCNTDKPGCDYSDSTQASYVMQQYASAMQGMTNIGRSEGLIFHHRLRDDPFDGTFGLLNESDNAPWPSYWAAWLITQKLEGATFIPGVGNDVLVDHDPTFLPDHRRLVFLGRDGRYIHVLWANRQYATSVTFEPTEDGVISGELFRQTDAERYYNGEKPDTISVVNGSFTLELPKSSVSPFSSGNDPYRNSAQSVIGGETYLLIEIREESRAPEGKACLICENGRVIGTDFLVYDAHSGLDTGAAQFSPQRSWDLSETEPGVQYAYTSDEYPPGRWRRYLYPHQQGRPLHHPNPLPPTGLLQERWRRQSRRRPSRRQPLGRGRQLPHPTRRVLCPAPGGSFPLAGSHPAARRLPPTVATAAPVGRAGQLPRG